VFRALTLAAVLAVTASLSACTGPSKEPSIEARHEPDVLVHLFEWPWASIASECPALGAAGVAGVQISPPQQHISLPDKGFPWWQDYQPTGYQLTSRRGDRAAFAAMVQACHQAGVKIYADAVLNHRQGAAFDELHHCGHAIANYQDRYEVQNCDLVGLPDLATENTVVRRQLADYLNDLLMLGVDGFRIDAAKHIPAADLRAILALLTRPARVYSEVLYTPAEPIQPTEYRDFGGTLEPRYAEKLARTFRGDSFTLLPDRLADLLPSNDSGAPGSAGGSVVYVDSHDTQRGTSTLSYKEDRYPLAVAFMLAYPYGTPLLMSSFAFERFDDGPPSTPDGVTTPVECGPRTSPGGLPTPQSRQGGAPRAGHGWVCEHRPALAMVGWRNRMAGAPLANWWATDDALGFARQGKGYFALNRAATPIARTVDTGLTPGRYRDVLGGASIDIDPTGKANLTIPALGAVALEKE
jgi:alpha-amylase